jgi:hypothetical protein
MLYRNDNIERLSLEEQAAVVSGICASLLQSAAASGDRGIGRPYRAPYQATDAGIRI